MINPQTALADFEGTLQHFATGKEAEDLDSILEKIDRVKTVNPAVYSGPKIVDMLERRGKILTNLVDEYLATAISQEFPLLSPELFEIKRKVIIEQRGKEYRIVADEAIGKVTNLDLKVPNDPSVKKNRQTKPKRNEFEIPLFAYTPLMTGDHKATLGKLSYTQRIRRYSDGWGYFPSSRRHTLTLEARLPGVIGFNLKQAYRQVLGAYYDIIKTALKDPQVGDLLILDDIPKPAVGAIWIPTPESMNVSVKTELIQKRKYIDPAMVFDIRGKRYLVKTWKVDDEEPFEHYIQEYSSGPVRKKLGR